MRPTHSFRSDVENQFESNLFRRSWRTPNHLNFQALLQKIKNRIKQLLSHALLRIVHRAPSRLNNQQPTGYQSDRNSNAISPFEKPPVSSFWLQRYLGLKFLTSSPLQISVNSRSLSGPPTEILLFHVSFHSYFRQKSLIWKYQILFLGVVSSSSSLMVFGTLLQYKQFPGTHNLDGK